VPSALEQRLTDGYAHVHELERAALSLEREGAQMLARSESAERLRSVMRKRRDVERELSALRSKLDSLRASPEAESYKGPTA